MNKQFYYMDIKQDKGAPYIAPYAIKPKRSFELRRERNNHSLPSINGPFKQQKVNTIRNQIDDKKNQITALKARINALKWQRQKHEKMKQKHNSEISFINTVRERLYQDKKYKQDIQDRKQKQLEYLKLQATSMRQKMIKDREMAKSIVNEQKEADAEEERQKRKQDEDNIRRIKSIQLAENQLKAKNIKKNQLQIQERMKQFNESRVTFARQNHHYKVEKSLSQKDKLERTLKRLRNQQQKMIEQCKKSQAGMLNSLYELESLNPEKKRRNSISSKTTAMKS